MKENTIPEKNTQQVPDTREQSRTLLPPVDIFETKDGLAVVADLPGVEKQDVQIDVDKGVLSIKANPKSLLPGEPLQREYALMNYFRQFQLSDAVDQENIRAEMKYGVLTVHLPRVAEKQPRKIEVQVGA